MVFNLKDKENTLSGKGFGLSLFGLNDNADKNALKQIAVDIKKGTGEITAMDKGFKTLSASGKELAIQARTIGKQTGNMSQAFLDASTNANKMTLSSKAAAVGMNILNAAINMGIMLAVSAVINVVAKKLGEAKKASEDAASAISGLNDEVKSLDDLKKSMLDMRTELDKGNLSQSDALGNYNKYCLIAVLIGTICCLFRCVTVKY